MKKILFIIFTFLLISTVSLKIKAETYNYVVSYKWGLIHKDAGDVKITKTSKGEGYELKLVAKTRPWADKVYKVRDTLISMTGKDKFRPIQYSSITHEKNKYKRDDIQFSYSGNSVKGHSTRYREDKKGGMTQSEKELSGISPVYDMLSIYFYLGTLDYANMRKGEVHKVTIFSGNKVETLELRCEGKEMVKLKDKREEEAWHILFKFTSGGGKKSSDDINCWISTDSRHIPLLIVGNLPIGQIRVNYTG